MGGKNYIDEKEFSDFKENFKIMVNTFNHSVTDIKEDLKSFKDTSQSNMFIITKDVSEMKGAMKTSNKLLWILVGTIFTVVGAACLASIRGG